MAKIERDKKREARIMQLRAEGMTLTDIAFQLVAEGFERVTPQGVDYIWKKVTQENAEKAAK